MPGGVGGARSGNLTAPIPIPSMTPFQATLFYIHDPMCSWCWGFRPTLEKLLASLPERIRVRYLLGGLAPDSDEPMSPAMQQQLQDTWRRIQQRIPGTEFNFDFWRRCSPRRSTWPACRAVIAARRLSADNEQAMILAIQQAYYLRALNPSDNDVLVTLAGEIGLPASDFSRRLHDSETEQQLLDEVALCRSMGVSSFPSLLLQSGPQSRWPIAVDYTDAQGMLDNITLLLEAYRV